MANKGSSRHLSALAAPKYYGIKRKEQFYVVKVNPGRHTLQRSIPIILALKKLSVANNNREAAKIIRAGAVLLNNSMVKEMKYPIGLGDIIELKGEGKAYKVGIDTHTRVSFDEIKKPDYDSHLFKVVGKYKARKGAVMIRLHDGRSVKAAKDVKVNDSVVVNQVGEIKDVRQLKVGAKCTVIAGVHTGASGKISEIKNGSINVVASALIAQDNGSNFETIIKNIMVTG